MSKSKDPVNYIVVGSRYQVLDKEGKLMPEFGVGKFRSGIHLEVATSLYVAMVTGNQWNGVDKPAAAKLAATAFALTDVFLDEMDKHFRIPPPSPPEDNSAKLRK